MIKAYYFVLLFAIFVTSCTKQGPQGAPGNTGATGPQGPQGPSGSPADVYYSNWIRVDSSSWTYGALDSTTVPDNPDANNYIDTIINYHADIPTPKITQDILDNGAVYFYIKDSTGNGVKANIGQVFQMLMQGNTSISVSATNRLNEGSLFVVSNSGFNTPNKLTLYTSWTGYEGFWDQSGTSFNPNAITDHEMAPKTKFFIRYVAVKGNVAGKTSNGARINFKDYKSVARQFGIPD